MIQELQQTQFTYNAFDKLKMNRKEMISGQNLLQINSIIEKIQS